MAKKDKIAQPTLQEEVVRHSWVKQEISLAQHEVSIGKMILSLKLSVVNELMPKRNNGDLECVAGFVVTLTIKGNNEQADVTQYQTLKPAYKEYHELLVKAMNNPQDLHIVLRQRIDYMNN